MGEIEKLARKLWRDSEDQRMALLEAQGRKAILQDEDKSWPVFRSQAEAALSALSDMGYRRGDAGHVVVPREPTAEMVEAVRRGWPGMNALNAVDQYRAMLDALPPGKTGGSGDAGGLVSDVDAGADPQPDQCEVCGGEGLGVRLWRSWRT